MRRVLAPGGEHRCARRAWSVADEREAPQPVEGVLRELIETEARIEAEVAESRRQAEQLVSAAREEAAAMERDGGPALEDALGTLRASIESECDARVRELAEEAEAELARYRGVDDATLGRLAAWVASRVTIGSRDG